MLYWISLIREAVRIALDGKKMMAELKYTGNIVTKTREYTPEEIKMLEEFTRKHPVESTVKAHRLLWMDNNMVQGASMYMNVSGSGKVKRPPEPPSSLMSTSSMK